MPNNYHHGAEQELFEEEKFEWAEKIFTLRKNGGYM